MSKDDEARATPVKPPTVNSTIKPLAHKTGVLDVCRPPARVANHLNTFTPVGTAITIVAAVK